MSQDPMDPAPASLNDAFGPNHELCLSIMSAVSSVDGPLAPGRSTQVGHRAPRRGPGPGEPREEAAQG